MNTTYRLKRNGWVTVSCWGNEWSVSRIPDEVSDCAARTGSREIVWDGRNAIPLDVPGGVRVEIREDRLPPIVIERPRHSDLDTAAAVGGLLGGLIGEELRKRAPAPEPAKTRRGGRGRR